MSAISVTASTTEYTVAVSGGPANATDWVGLYVVGATQNDWLDWKYLSDSRLPPATGLAAATITFPDQPSGEQYECRFMENNTYTVLATAAVPSPPVVGVIYDGRINVMEPAFGATGNPSGDDTAAIKLAATAAKATLTSWGSKELWAPPGLAFVCTDPVDFRGISRVKFDSWLNYWGPVNEPCFIVGQPSQNVGNKHEFFGLTSLSVPYNQMKHPLIRFMGMRGGSVHLGSCNGFVEVYAEAGVYESTAYAEFHLGQTQRLELRSPRTPGDATGGWINSNQFYGGNLAQLRIGGPWIDVVSIVGNAVATATPHNLVTGDLVEAYNGTAADGTFQLVTVVDATHFTVGSAWAGSANPGNGWRCMSRSGYPHNDNLFLCGDMEDFPAIFHCQGQMNHFEKFRTEASGPLVWGPDTFGNTYEASNTSHGHLPAPGDFPMTVMDFSNGKNWAGWKRIPKPWGQN